MNILLDIDCVTVTSASTITKLDNLELTKRFKGAEPSL